MANLYFDNNISQTSKTIQLGKGTDASGNTVSVPIRAYTTNQFQQSANLSVEVTLDGGGAANQVRATVVPSSISFSGQLGSGGRREAINGTITVNVTAFPEAQVNKVYTVTIRSEPIGSFDVNEFGFGEPEGSTATINVQVFAATVVNGTVAPVGGGNAGGGAPVPATPQPGADIPFNMLFVKGIIPATTILNVSGGSATIVQASSTQILRINSLSVSPPSANVSNGTFGGGFSSQAQVFETGVPGCVVYYNGVAIGLVANFFNTSTGVYRFNVITKNEPIYVMPNTTLTIGGGNCVCICSYEILQF